MSRLTAYVDPSGSPELVSSLLKYGGFPEPFLAEDEREYRLWSKERRRRVVKEDIVDLEKVRDLPKIDLMVDLLNSRIGSLLSINSLTKDLKVAFNTASHWLDVLESLYYVFRIPPYTEKLARSIQKERKLYYWDWAETKESSARFENMVASHLLKYVHYLEDYEGYRASLHFLRDKDGREVDFLVVKEGQPLFAVECKSGEKSISPHLIYFKKKIGVEQIYQVHLGSKDVGDADSVGRVLPFHVFCSQVLKV